MERNVLQFAIYPGVCGFAFIFGWDPLALRIMFGPFELSWEPPYEV